MRNATAVLAVALLALVAVASATPLDDYIAKPDPTYKWVLNSTIEQTEYTYYNMFLTSQSWLTPQDSDRPIWEHWVQIAIPKVRDTNDWCFMYINGNGQSATPPSTMDLLTEVVAINTRACAATIYQIPNEPIHFADGRRRSEDAIIAYTWNHFLDHPDQPEWLLRLPMTKAVLKGMDAVEELLASIPHAPKPTQWIVGGASKRGWTTWTVGAADAVQKKRVKAIVPIVMDALNLQQVINHMWMSYGAWTFAFSDYVEMNTTRRLNTPEFQQMANIIDPYVYRDRLTMPKYVIDSTGDEFFQLQDSWFWYNQMVGETNLRMVPNAEHSLAGHAVDVALAVATWARTIVLGTPRPKMSWTRDADTGRLVVTASPKPTHVKMWHGHNSKARDFRLLVCEDVLHDPSCIQPIFWTNKELDPQSDGTYVAELAMPEQGWSGFFVECDWLVDQGLPGEHWIKYTTQTSVIPNIYPFPPCGNPCGP